MRYLLYLLLTVLCIHYACIRKSDQNDANSSIDTAQSIVDSTISVHGGNLYDQSFVSFTFRDRKYTRSRNHGMYTFERIFTNPDDTSQMIRDVLTNEGFTREINGEQVAVHDTMASKYSNSINSVIYFAMLPYRLNDEAVIKKYLGRFTINGIPYHKINVTFRKEGGGKDYDDVFIYWIHPETYTMDYLAYSFHVDGGGIRFREAINPRVVAGIRFQDYINYKMPDIYPVSKADSFFVEGKLEKLSEILLEDLEVEIYP